MTLPYDIDRTVLTIGGLRIAHRDAATIERDIRADIKAQSQRALLELEWLQSTLEPGYCMMYFGPLPRYHVTRRGNVYDNVNHCTVWATWGYGSVRQRRVMAQRYIDAMEVPC